MAKGVATTSQPPPNKRKPKEGSEFNKSTKKKRKIKT